MNNPYDNLSEIELLELRCSILERKLNKYAQCFPVTIHLHDSVNVVIEKRDHRQHVHTYQIPASKIHDVFNDSSLVHSPLAAWRFLTS